MYSLAAYLDERRSRQFSWRDWNCAHFAAEWVEHAEGVRLLSGDGCPQAETLFAAVRLATSKGGLRRAVSDTLGREPRNPLASNVGDLVLFEGETGGAGMLGICNGASAVTLHPVQGFSSAPMRAASCVWKIHNV